MKKFSLSIVLCLLFNVLNAQSIEGSWTGVLDFGTMKLKINLHISEEDGQYLSLLDSPQQGMKGYEAEKTTYEEGVLEVEMTGLKANLKGQLKDDILDCEFEQRGNKLSLEMTRMTPFSGFTRPQDPKEFLYDVEEVVFKNKKEEIELSGTLTSPKDKSNKQVVILISGSGPQDRNSEIVQFDHRPFLVLSDYLTKNGITVLRYDERGVGESSGNFQKASSADFASDVKAAISYLQSRKDLEGYSIGLIGHSEGGLIAPMVAANNDDVDFIVSLAGPGIAIDKLMLNQISEMNRTAGSSAKLTKTSIKFSKKLYKTLKSNPEMSKADLSNKLEKIIQKNLSKLPKYTLQGMSEEQYTNLQIETLTSPWYRYFMQYDPTENIKNTSCPVLALNGSLDVQVTPDDNLKGFEKALKKGKNKNYSIVKLEGINHMFQKAKSGSVAEYQLINETFNENAMKLIVEWIQKLP